MRRVFQMVRDFFQKGDMVLLLLCAVTTAFGCLIIASATNAMGSTRHIIVQITGALIGIMLYGLISSVDTEFWSEHRMALVAFNTLLLLMLIPFGTDNGSGNKSWLDLPLIPFYIQPAEICKISYILITASVMVAHQNKLSGLRSIFHMGFHFVILAGLNVFISGDAGVSLIFLGIFLGMALAGGVRLFWFLVGAGGIVAAFPFLWNVVLGEYQQTRIMALLDPMLDPNGTGVRYQTVRALRSLTGGGMTGQGLFQGHRTQTPGALFAQHTDFIFCAIGEELGFIGCAFVLLLLFLIVARCIWVGVRSHDTLRRLVCFGVASAMILQVIVNIGMCIEVMPVIGLTLPFISYGGSSIITMYAMLGLVSGVFARPSPPSHERYIHPPLQYQ